jgi:Zn-dependent M28 family amino/carboxypeptidase
MRHARTSILTTICALLLPGLVSAQPSSPSDAGMEAALRAVRPEAIRAHMRFLADDLLEGRETASRGYDLAARYVETVFQGLGLEPAGAGGGYLQPVPLMRTETVESESTLALVRDGRRTELKYGEDFLASVSGLAEADASVTAPVVFVGFGVTAPELEYDDYAGVDVRGKIVVLLMGAPASFPADQRAFYSDNLGKIQTAASRGAVGALGMPTPVEEQRLPWEFFVRNSKTPSFSWADEKGRGRALPPEIRGLALMNRKTAELFFEGAPRSLQEVFETAKAGRPQAFDLPVQASLRSVGRGERSESPNVAAVLRGSDPRLRDEYVVVTAHLDHMGVGAPIEGDAIYNGAYDNASGTAILLELARAFTRLPTAPRRSVLFLAVTAEEKGLQGSDFFVQRPTVPVDKIVANINLDMFLMLYPLRDVIAYGSEHSSLERVVVEAAGRLGIGVSPDPWPEEVVFIRSDHYSFVRQGIPAMMLTAGIQTGDSTGGEEVFQRWLRERYHKPGDDMNQEFDFEAGAQFVRLNFLIAWQVAQEEKAPSWNPGDFFGEKFPRRTVEKP